MMLLHKQIGFWDTESMKCHERQKVKQHESILSYFSFDFLVTFLPVRINQNQKENNEVSKKYIELLIRNCFH